MSYFAGCTECGRPFVHKHFSNECLQAGLALHKSLGQCHPENPLRGWPTHPAILCSRLGNDFDFVTRAPNFDGEAVRETLGMALSCPLPDGLKSIAREGLNYIGYGGGVTKGNLPPLGEVLRKLLEGILDL